MSSKVNKKRKANSNRLNEPPKKRQKTNKNNNQKQKKQNNEKLYAWKCAQNCISWLLKNKVSNDKFFKNYFGIKPLLIKRNQNNYYSRQQLKFELKDVYQIIKQNELKFGQHMICKV